MVLQEAQDSVLLDARLIWCLDLSHSIEVSEPTLPLHRAKRACLTQSSTTKEGTPAANAWSPGGLACTLPGGLQPALLLQCHNISHDPHFPSAPG